MLKKLKQILFREKYVIAAFAVTWIFLLCFAIAVGLAPFGDKCLLAMDMHGQYYPMMLEKLSDFFAVWSWDGGLGFSALVQSAYYTNSIFLLLMLPFSGAARISALHMVIFLKIALSAAAFAYYVGKKFEKYDIFTAVFGVAYGLGAYTLAFLGQPMWLDIVLFLPLILSAMDRLIAGKSPIPYALLLALAIFSNFYISFALCIFLVLWFIVSIIVKKWEGFRNLVKTTLKFGLASLVGGLLCAFMLIPLLLHMENWISSSLGYTGELVWYHTFAEIADAFSFKTETSLEFGPANVFCGSAAIFLLIAFWFHSEISAKRKIVLTVFTAFLFVSLELSVLDFIWHGLHFPNQLPGRWSFAFIFVLLLIGYETLSRYKGLRIRGLIVPFLAAEAFFLIGISKSENVSGRYTSAIIVLGVFVILVFALAVKKLPRVSRVAKTGIALVLLFDICLNAALVSGQYTRVSEVPVYVKHDEQMLLYTQKYQSGSDDFYRSELTNNFTFNCGQRYGFKGLTYYSSTMNGNTYYLMERLGNRVYAKNVSTVYMPTPFQDMMFGVKYHYIQSGRTLAYAKRLEQGDNISVYASPYALPIAYAVKNNIKNIEKTSKTGLSFQEKFIGLAANMKKKMLYEAAPVGLDISNGFVQNGYLCARDVTSPVTYTMEFEVLQDGYFYVEFDFNVGDYKVSVNDGSPRSGYCNANPTLGLDYLYVGDTVSVTVTTRGYHTMVYGIRGYTAEKSALSEAYRTLAAEALQVEYASDTEIRGEITVADDCVLYASIPAENGWEVYIDGVKAETYDLGLGLLFCDIEAGTHRVEYRYRAPGLALGIAISSVTAVSLAAYAVWEVRKKKKTEIS